MNKLIIGLLIIAAGAGAYFLLKNKKNTTETVSINKEFIIGKWKTASIEPLKDSAQPKFYYEFQKDGIAYRTISDTTKADTVSYAWKESSGIILKDKAADTTGILLAVVTLTADSMKVKTSDNSEILFIKLK
ncbi:MAG: hypothetical protein JNK27_12365 [Chitinophagaceae bacterium]|nr:hypothetical protein [Chitinophagaceae bacterium]